MRGWVIRVDVQHLPRPTRAKKTLWLWWSGPPGMTPGLDLCCRGYLHRFDIEHTIKFQKATLGWVTPSLRLPEQADRWTAIILASYAQLVLARPLAADQRLPWERPRSLVRLTPGRVRRDFPRVRALLSPLANPRKSCIPGPGRPRAAAAAPLNGTPPSRRPHKGGTAEVKTKAKTTDGGKTWTGTRAIFDPGQNNATIGNVVVVDPRNGTHYDFFEQFQSTGDPSVAPRGASVGFVKFTDGGNTWSGVTTVASQVLANDVDPNTGALLRTGAGLPSAAVDPQHRPALRGVDRRPLHQQRDQPGRDLDLHQRRRQLDRAQAGEHQHAS